MAATGSARRGGLVDGIRIDLRRLHDTWMELVFPRQRQAHSVLGRWTPSTTQGMIAYRLWSLLGVFVVAIAYPLALVGVVTRFYSRRIDTMIAGIGILGVVVVAALVWGGLTVVAHFQLSWEGFLAVGAAGAVATVAAGLSALFTRIDGRATTVLLAYPSAMTAIFLPPVVAAYFSEALWARIFPSSDAFAEWILDTFLWIGGFNEYLRASYSLESGPGLVLMWLALSVPLGWFLGLIVSLADVVRPKEEDGE